MSAETALAEAAAKGVTLTLSGGKIIYSGPPEAVTDDLLGRLRQHKAELLQLLAAEAEKAERALHTNYGTGHPDAQPLEPMPPPIADWPDDLTQLLRRVATHYEWSEQDRQDFRQWARRSPQGMTDAAEFLRAEAARLPAPGLSDRRRVVLGMLAADASINYAWTCGDDGSDPVTLTLAIRAVGTVELAIPRAKFDAFALPGLMADLAAKQEGTA